MAAGTRRLAAAVVAIGVAVVVGAVPDRGEASAAHGPNGTALAHASAVDIGGPAPSMPDAAFAAAPPQGLEPARSPAGADDRAAPARPVDLAALERAIRGTPAIGLLTKLKLDHDVRQLVADFQRYHRGDGSVALESLDERFDRLLRGVVMLLRDDDPVLAEKIAAARGALWHFLMDHDRDKRRTVGL